MVLDFSVVRWFLIFANAVFWLLIGGRVLRSWTDRKPDPPDDAPRLATAAQGASSRWSRLILVPVSLVMLAYVVMTLAYSDNPGIAGPLLFPISLPLQLAGIVVTLAGLGLMAWAYVVFRSFRLMAEISPGHELCSDGPFAFLRHPIYTGIDLFYFGTFLMLPHLGFLVQAVANLVVCDLRGRIEEQVLLGAFGEQYRQYMARTKRLIPGVY